MSSVADSSVHSASSWAPEDHEKYNLPSLDVLTRCAGPWGLCETRANAGILRSRRLLPSPTPAIAAQALGLAQGAGPARPHRRPRRGAPLAAARYLLAPCFAPRALHACCAARLLGGVASQRSRARAAGRQSSYC